MADIHVKNNEQLTQLIERAEGWLDDSEGRLCKVEKAIEDSCGETEETVSAMSEVRESLESTIENVKEISERLRELDNALPVGEKIYHSIAPTQTQRQREVREGFARCVLDAALVERNAKPRFGSELYRADAKQVESVASDGGNLVPDEQREEIIRVVERYGVARKILRIVPMSGKTLLLPTNANQPAVSWDIGIAGGTELASPDATIVTFERPTITAHKLIGISMVSLELTEDSIPLISDFLVDVFGIAISKAEDAAAFTDAVGAANPFNGILNTAGITNVVGSANTYLGTLQATGGTGGYNKLLEVMDSADEDTAESGTWLFSNSVLNAIRQVKDLQENPLWGAMAGAEPGTLFGRPFVRSRVMPKTSDGAQATKPFLAFGDFRFHVMGDRRQLSFDISTHAAFREAGLVMRVMERVGFVNALTAPFALLSASA